MKKIKPTIKLSDSGNLHIHIPMFIRRMRGRKMVFTPDTLDGENEGMPETVQTAIVQSLARAFSWADILESGEIKSISELARDLDVDSSYVARTLKLTTLAPDIIEAIINGEEPSGLSLSKLVKTFPLSQQGLIGKRSRVSKVDLYIAAPCTDLSVTVGNEHGLDVQPVTFPEDFTTGKREINVSTTFGDEPYLLIKASGMDECELLALDVVYKQYEGV